VNIQGLGATLQLGDISLHRVLTKAVPGDCSLQETESLEDFLIKMKMTAASNMSGTTMKGVMALSMIITIFAATSLHFF
jgi:hypothetical protein